MTKQPTYLGYAGWYLVKCDIKIHTTGVRGDCGDDYFAGRRSVTPAFRVWSGLSASPRYFDNN